MSARIEEAVARAIWPWRGGDAGRGTGRPGRRLARPLLNAASAAAAALVLWFVFDARIAAGAVGAIAGAVLLCGALAPRWYRPIERAQALLGRAIGTAITWILLGAVFAAVFVPGRLLLLARRRDPLRRKAYRSGRSAWIARDAAFAPERYARHF